MSEAEFLAFAEKFRPWTERAMKIEVAPWIRDYVVDMQELYCELILEKIAYRASGRKMTTVENYQVLFDQNALVPNKILAKGDPGMGKTTWAKKIAWDWAKGHFKKFSLVLFIFLKLVRPNDSLEEVMLKQIPELVGLEITQSKLKSFMEHFGRQCLLICDGLDEHALGSNKDVLKVIRHEKYLDCNVLLTSRPHSTIDVQKHFDTIISVEGFTRSEARKFAYCIVRDDEIAEQILDFNPTAGKQEVSLCKCPILLSFICILVRENALDLSNTTLPTAEIYARMIQCLYKKFTIRREIDFDEIEFTRVVGLVGKLAWETLSSDEPLFKRSRVEGEVGKDAFDYGFLIGNEDLIGDVKTDILITFPHRSIQEFFGAFFFVLQLIDQKDIVSLLGDNSNKPIFMMNPLFLHFVFWFLSDQCSDDYFTLDNRDEACDTLHSYIYHKIHKELGIGITKKFQGIDFQRALETKDEISIEQFRRILVRFNRLKYLVVRRHDSDDTVAWILDHILPTCSALQVVGKDESRDCVLAKFLEADAKSINISVSEKAYRAGIMTNLLQKAVQWNRHPVVYLFLTEGKTVDLSDILHQEMHQLHVIGIAQPVRIIAEDELVSATFLTHLSIIGHIIVCHYVIFAIDKALRDGKVPRLQSFCFTDADDTFEMNDLFKAEVPLPNVTHLNISICKFYRNYLEALHRATTNGWLPNLTSLAVSDDKSSLKPAGKNYFDYTGINLTDLSVKDMTQWGFKQLLNAINGSGLRHLMKLCLSVKLKEKCDLKEIEPDKIPLLKHLSVQRCIESKGDLKCLSRLLKYWSLQTLDISHSRGITGNLSVLKSRRFRTLENLILHDCELNKQDLISLDRANAKGRLSNLVNLDLSENCDLIESFDALSSTWSSLKRLRIDYETANQVSKIRNGFDILRPLVDKACIPLVQDLRITATHSFPERTGLWEHLERLDFAQLTDKKLHSMLVCLINSVQIGDLPSLQTVCVLTEGIVSIDNRIISALRQKGVDICAVNHYVENIMSNAGLTQ